MRSTGTSLPNALMLVGLLLAGSLLWVLHAGAWDLGRRSSVLNYDTAQYAVAARELADTGRLATIFALPLELERHANPPWPLAVVQPGMVITEALVLKLIPNTTNAEGRRSGRWARPDQQEWALLVVPFIALMLTAASIGLAARHLMRVTVPEQAAVVRASAGLALGLTFLLDPEAQHFAVGPFTELPFTLGLILAVTGLAMGEAARRPLLYGLLLGLTGAFRANMLWLAPLLAMGAALSAERDRRPRVLLTVLAGFALPLAPWWFYKWRAFGSPGWDLTRFVIWDGISGHSWFSLYHLPSAPVLPTGGAAFAALAAKIARNLPDLVLATMTGPRALWVAALFAWLLVAGPTREKAIAGWCVLAIGAVSLLAAAVSIPWLRYVFPARILTETAGILACWGLLSRAADFGAGATLRRAASVFVALLALGWGGWQTSRGLSEARAVSRERGTPGPLTMLQIAVLMNREIPAGEPVMSNLGPELAWHARRPIIHLALRPENIAACRERLEFRHVMLVFRDPARAWAGWSELVANPVEASRDPDLGIERARQYKSPDGFTIAWLELKPPAPKFARGPAASGGPLAALSGSR